MEQLNLNLQNDLHILRNKVKEAEMRRKFLRQQILNQFSHIDIDMCKRILREPYDDLHFDDDRIAKALAHNLKTTEKITKNILNFKSSVIETLEGKELRKIYFIEGAIEEIKYELEFITEFKVVENETKEFVKEIQKLVFNPTIPVLEKMSQALIKEHSIETIISSLYMFHCLKEEQSKVIEILQQYQEIDIDIHDDGSSVIHVIVTETSRFFLEVGITYNLYSTNFFHKISLSADDELLIRHSQHTNIAILKGEQELFLDGIVGFIESMFDVPEEESSVSGNEGDKESETSKEGSEQGEERNEESGED